MQRAEQIVHHQVRSALENCAIKMANVDGELSYFSKLLRVPEERMPTADEKGVFATSIRGQPSIQTLDLAKLPCRDMTPEEQKAHRQRMVDLYGMQKPTGSVGSGGNTVCDTKPRAAVQDKSQPSLAPKPSNPHAGDHTEPSSKWGDS
jgi:hypothetical protein